MKNMCHMQMCASKKFSQSWACCCEIYLAKTAMGVVFKLLLSLREVRILRKCMNKWNFHQSGLPATRGSENLFKCSTTLTQRHHINVFECCNMIAACFSSLVCTVIGLYRKIYSNIITVALPVCVYVQSSIGMYLLFLVVGDGVWTGESHFENGEWPIKIKTNPKWNVQSR